MKNTASKMQNVVKFVDNKNKNNIDNNISHKKKSDPSKNKQSMTAKYGSITEIQLSDFDTSTDI